MSLDHIAVKVLIIIGVILLTKTPVTEQQCAGNCFASGPIEEEDCWCDAECSKFKNCCDDYEVECTNETLCENRCFDSYDSAKQCQCNDLCLKYENCCEDYYEQCLPGSCNGTRCGERDDAFSCQCDSTCAGEYDCCEDFIDTCTKPDSCKFRCETSIEGETCSCEEDCLTSGGCCEDYKDMCSREDAYFCNGKCDVEKGGCSCMDTCEDEKNCCTDYQQSCKDATHWVDDECTPADEMSCPNGYEDPIVILFSMDGFRNTYLYRDITPNLWKMATCGVHSPYMRSVFPTKTFPNHYSIATGLYPESHGIIGNKFYDHELEEEFSIGSPAAANPHWWGGQPIWVTASNQGLKSASYFWVGSDVNITRYPDYYYNFDSSVPDEERMLQALKWLDLPVGERPSIIMLYIEEVDGAGHDEGPDGQAVNVELAKADKIAGMLWDGLKARNLDKCVNLAVVADHGMASISCDRLTYCDKYGVPVNDVYFRSGATGRIGKSKDESKWDLYKPFEIKEQLQCQREETHLEPFIKYEYLPKRVHYGYNDKIEDVILLVDDEWIVGGNTGTYTSCNGGTHGWDNESKEMRALFVAHGPAFKRAYNTTEPFDNIEIYNMICDILDLNPAPNNGTVGSLNHLLTDPQSIIILPSDETPKSCPYPADNTESDNLGCSQCEDEGSANQLLDIPASDAEKYQNQNMLTGTPEIYPFSDDEVNYCILNQHDHITAYNWDKKMPYFVSFVLDGKYRDMTSQSYCTRPDIRVDSAYSTACSDFSGKQDITSAFMFNPALSSNYKSDATLLSNVVPVYKPFTQIWDEFAKILHNWSQLYNGISVVVGPVFDYNYDGHADTKEIIEKQGEFLVSGDKTSAPVPTHIFAIVTKCRDPASSDSIRECSSSPEKITVISFLIPNYKETPCTYDKPTSKWVAETIHQHVARVRDVELLTRVSFLPDWTTKSGLSQNTFIEGTRVRLHLPEYGSSWMNDLIETATANPELFTTTGASLPFSSKLLTFAASLISVALTKLI